MKLDRRELLKNAAFVSGAALVGTSWPPSKKSFAEAVLSDLPNLPSPANSGIEHIVVLTMENRSFDHFLGWLPNADGKQAGLTFADSAGVSHATHSLSGDYTGCPHPDPDHSYGGARVEYDGGRMDGFLRADSNDVYSIGYYGEQDIPFYAALARTYTACDRYFAAILGPTFPNRLFLHAAQTDRLDDSTSSTVRAPLLLGRVHRQRGIAAVRRQFLRFRGAGTIERFATSSNPRSPSQIHWIQFLTLHRMPKKRISLLENAVAMSATEPREKRIRTNA